MKYSFSAAATHRIELSAMTGKLKRLLYFSKGNEDNFSP